MRRLSKSKLIAFRQCPKRLWLEIHQPHLAQVSAKTEAIFRSGHQVGDIARRLYDPDGAGSLIDIKDEGVDAALAKTQQLLAAGRPIFEAGFAADGGLAFSDVLLPEAGGAWRMVEVKQSGSVKDYHRDDVAIQSYLARSSGVELSGVAVAHIDTRWTYTGGNDYDGLLTEKDLTADALGRAGEVRGWIKDAQRVVQADAPPPIQPGRQCTDPFECGFTAHCNAGLPRAEFPVEWLPRIQARALKDHIADNDVADMSDVPPELLTDTQRRVRDCTLNNAVYFDAEGAKADLTRHPLPALFLDFETISFVVPQWAGTRPYQQVPFQFSLHSLRASGELLHEGFLDVSGSDPSRSFAERLVSCCGTSEPIFVYNAGFESSRIGELVGRLPDLSARLESIRSRLVDLWPIALRRYYHPSQQGSWSIKKLLPAVVAHLRYDDLDGVADGAMAQEAFLEAIDAETSAARKEELQRQLLAYCALDTMAMVEIWRVFSGGSMTNPTRDPSGR